MGSYLFERLLIKCSVPLMPQSFFVSHKTNRGVDKEEQCTKKQVPITDFFKEINCST